MSYKNPFKNRTHLLMTRKEVISSSKQPQETPSPREELINLRFQLTSFF